MHPTCGACFPVLQEGFTIGGNLLKGSQQLNVIESYQKMGAREFTFADLSNPDPAHYGQMMKHSQS